MEDKLLQVSTQILAALISNEKNHGLFIGVPSARELTYHAVNLAGALLATVEKGCSHSYTKEKGGMKCKDCWLKDMNK